MTTIEHVYQERANCAIALARAARALGLNVGFGLDPKSPDWPVLFIDLPTGQVSWHLTVEARRSAPDIRAYDGAWDGHDTETKYRRLAEWEPEPRPSKRRTSRRSRRTSRR